MAVNNTSSASSSSSIGNSAPFEAKFKVVDEIGEGGFGKVYLIKLRSEPTSENSKLSENSIEMGNLAMKVIKISRIARSQKQVQYAKNEMKILASIDHPFIVKLFYAFHCSKRLYLVMEFLNGGDMRMLMDQKLVFTEQETKFYTANIILALTHLHKNLVIYRDLKPENIMFDNKGKLKLVDLGLCKLFDHSDDKETSTICGTIEYLAPEILMKKPYGHMVDWWSLGILIHDMLLGYQPFKSKEKKKLVNKIISETPVIPQIISKPATSFIKKMLFKNPNKRLRWVVEDNQDTQQLAIQHHRFFKNMCWESILSGKVNSPADINEFASNNERFSTSVRNPTIRWSRLSGPDHTTSSDQKNRHKDRSQSDVEDQEQLVSNNEVFKILDGFSYISPNSSLQIS